jgi:hypothetical protein
MHILADQHSYVISNMGRHISVIFLCKTQFCFIYLCLVDLLTPIWNAIYYYFYCYWRIPVQISVLADSQAGQLQKPSCWQDPKVCKISVTKVRKWKNVGWSLFIGNLHTWVVFSPELIFVHPSRKVTQGMFCSKPSGIKLFFQSWFWIVILRKNVWGLQSSYWFWN